MDITQSSKIAVALILMTSIGTAAAADVITTDYKEEWMAMVGETTLIDFTGIGEVEYVTDQYAELGAIFSDGDDVVLFYVPEIYPNDGYGCRSSPTPIVVEFTTPQYWVAVEFPGLVWLHLYFEDRWMSSHAFYDDYDTRFGGLLSTDPFDEVRIADASGAYPFVTNIDDLHFGPRMPGDATGDAQVDVDDLIAVILDWGPCPEAGPCAPDVTEDGQVNVADLVEVVTNWN